MDNNTEKKHKFHFIVCNILITILVSILINILWNGPPIWLLSVQEWISRAISSAPAQLHTWNFEIVEKLIIPLISVGSSLLGVWIGSKLSYRSQIKESHLKMLQDAYADTITSAVQRLKDPTSDSLATLISSCEKTRVLCSDESDAVLLALEKNANIREFDDEAFFQSIHDLRKAARKDIESASEISNNDSRKKRKNDVT